MNRRDFVLRIGGTLLAVPVVLKAVACGGDDDGGGTPDSGGGGGSFTAMNSDGAGHTHTLTIFCADLDGGGVTYTSSSAGHTHEVTISATDLAAIAAGTTVMIETDTLHAHTWVITKPAASC